MNVEKYVKSICGRMATGRNIPEELRPYSCFMPDAGYCIVCIPECFADEGELDPEGNSIPLPEKYVLATGYRFVAGVPCVSVEYDSGIGAVVGDEYYSWR
ncbi:MAG: hypothetical protein IJ523_08855 [Succinivibrionaceae bacterium]|nr:hypothetical protein [Succinivibrionaceae bacterium]